MKFHTAYLNHRRKPCAGFTLVEMMTSVGLGLILLVGAAILYINGNECFVAMANYQNLDKYSCNALDLLSREVRGASSVTATNTSSISFTNATKGTTIVITYDPTGKTLILSGSQVLAETGNSTVTNLTGCDNWGYLLFTGVPNITTDIAFYSLTSTNNLSDAKIVQMSWKCSRTILGAKLTTESVQTAQIVLRNKTSN